MEFEENEYRRSLWAIMIHVITWVFMCYLRRKNFSIPKALGWLTFNLFSLTFLYLNSYMLTTNTVGDPNSKIIYATLVVSDCFFSFLYVLLSDYLYPKGYFGFTVFPKIFVVISFYFYFDDRSSEILSYFVLTTLLTSLSGIHAEELLVDVYREEVGDEFNVLDYYSLLYLDVPYIAKMCYYAITDIISEYRDKLLGKKKDKKKNE
jgi:hypothetical protein